MSQPARPTAPLPEGAPHEPATLSRADAALVVALAILSIAYVGYSYGLSDMGTWIPLIEHAQNPHLYRNDWFVTLNEGFNAPFIWLVARLARVAGLEGVFLTLHLVERALLVVAVYGLARRLSGNRLAAAVAVVAALFAYEWQLGGNPVAAPITVPHTLAIPVGVLAILLLTRDRPVAAASVAAAATYVHLLVGTEIALLVLGVCFADPRLRAAKPWRPAVWYAVLAAPVLIPIAIGQWQSSHVDALTTQEYMTLVAHIRAPWHYLPSSWPLHQYALFFVYGLAAALTGVLTRERLNARVNRQLCFLLGAILALCLIGTFFVEWLQNRTLLKLQFFRLMVFVKVIASIYLATFLAESLAQERLVPYLFSALAIGLLPYPYGFGICMLVIGTTRLRERSTDGSRWRVGWVLLGLLAAALTVALVTAPRSLLNPTIMQLAWFGLAATAALFWWSWTYAMQGRPAYAILCAALPFLGLVVASRATGRPLNWARVRSAAAGRVTLRLSTADDWGTLCAWIREQTQVDAVFITPPQLEGFRLRTQRAAVLEFKSFAYREENAREWWERLRDLTNGVEFRDPGNRAAEIQRGYASLSRGAIEGLATKYNAAFVLRERPDSLSLPVAHENQSYVLYHVVPRVERRSQDEDSCDSADPTLTCGIPNVRNAVSRLPVKVSHDQ